MKNGWIFIVVVAVGFLVGVQFLRMDGNNKLPVESSKDTVENTKNPERRVLKLKVTTSLRRISVFKFRLLSADDKELYAEEISRNPQVDVDFVTGTSKIEISAPEHHSKIFLWPENNILDVTLLAKDKGFLEKTTLPDDTGEPTVAMRFKESQSRQVLSRVEIYLDGELAGVSTKQGTFVLAVNKLKNSKEMILKKIGYDDIRFPLTSGKIDELDIDPVILNKTN